jgi:polar amino acid transport system substrate-binding protein
MRTAKIVATFGTIGMLTLSGCASAASTDADASADPSSAECVAEVPASALIKEGTLAIGTNATLPPLSCVDADGKISGQRFELGEELAARLCLEPEWTNAQATTLQPSIDAGRIDIMNIGYFVTDERMEVMRMIPTERMGISISVQTGNPEGVTAIEDLAGLSVGATTGSFEEATIKSISEELVAKGLDPIKVQSFNEYDIVFQSLSSGQIDGAATTSPVASYYAELGGFDAAIEGLELTDTSLVVAGDNAELADAVVEALDSMKEDGFYDDLLEKYNLEPVETFESLYTGE